jgi:hypothetical protein
VAVLITGITLVLFGHVTTGGLTTACAALAGLYAAWCRFRRPKPLWKVWIGNGIGRDLIVVRFHHDDTRRMASASPRARQDRQ